MNEKELAEKHGVTIESIRAQLKLGLDVEKEHYSDMPHRRKIALDHLEEIPDYYTRLKQMEDKAKYDPAAEQEELNEDPKKPALPKKKPQPLNEDERSDAAFEMLKGKADSPEEASSEGEPFQPEVSMEVESTHAYKVGQSVDLNGIVSGISELPNGKHQVTFKLMDA